MFRLFANEITFFFIRESRHCVLVHLAFVISFINCVENIIIIWLMFVFFVLALNERNAKGVQGERNVLDN